MAGWCGDSDYSTCLCSSATLLTSLLLLLALLWRHHKTLLSRCRSSSSTSTDAASALHKEYNAFNSPSKTLLHVFLLLSLSNPLLFSVMTFSEKDNAFYPAKITSVVFNVLAWGSCSGSVFLDFQSRIGWPGNEIVVFLSAEVLIHAITISRVYSNSDENIAVLVLGVISFVILMCLLVLSLFKNRILILFGYRGMSEEKLFGEDDMFSDSADSFTTANVSTLFHDNSPKSGKRRGFFFASHNSTDVDVEESLLRGRCSDMSDVTHHSRQYSSPDRNSWSLQSVGFEEQSNVQSVIDRNLQKSHLSRKTDKTCADLEERSSYTSRSSLGWLDTTPSMGLTSTGALSRVVPPSSRLSNALNNANCNMVGSLAPRGQVSQLGSNGTVSMGMRVKDLQSSDPSQTHHPLENLQIKMGKYGFRRQKCSPRNSREDESEYMDEIGGDFPKRLSSFDRLERLVGPDGTVRKPKVSVEYTTGYDQFSTPCNLEENDKAQDSVRVGDLSNMMMEVEFEVIFNLGNFNMDDSSDIDISGGHDLDPVPQQWSVWRTGKEVMSLHAVLVGLLGDLAPRRPKMTIVGPQSDTTSISRESIMSDRRYIGSYIRALLSQSLFHCAEFCSFCEIPPALVPQPPVKANNPLAASQTDPSNVDHSGNSEDSKDQWRRIFLNLRKNLKPKDLAVRCRVYDGVVSGKDITKWLLTSVYKYAHDYAEAQRIAQGLLEADLLIPVCAGYDQSSHDQSTATDFASLSVAKQAVVKDKLTLSTFKSRPSYIYRYPGRGGSQSGIGAFSLFGHKVVTTISSFQLDTEGVAAGQADTADGGVFRNMFTASGGESPSSISSFTVRSCLMDDQWEVSRRFNQFSQLHKILQKEGIKPSEAFPTTSFSKLLRGQVSSAPGSADGRIKERASALEVYLNSAIEAIMLAVRDMPGDSFSDPEIYADEPVQPLPQRHRLLTLLAEFLDDDHSHLRLCYIPPVEESAERIPASSNIVEEDTSGSI